MCNCPCHPVSSFTPNPDQLLMFDPLESDKTEGYLAGFARGDQWDASWMPGGPHVYDGKYKDLHEKSKAKHDEWHRGFKDGLAARLQSNPHFAAWWKTARKASGHLRYSEPECLTD